ncbi:hypothetical protein EV643_102619 [Kribbella sp. VKM Ac-2527]|uniref:Uncharacterized protein n=1 Tax=Kribbella caucasensis TaxID=2512215 RepID=A0A4R6KMF8_9ACTN|nr:hypothetical protein [Kribbella sp. VKM Ac-2527]TDO52777.1 hypothetical protein EV643_102619 [Kribbella sp. VKM Ac-2527]
MDIAKFNSVFSDARRRQRTEPDFDVTTAQAYLRELIAKEPDDDERDWALRMIDRLAEPLPDPPQRSELYAEAGRIHSAAFYSGGTTEQQLAALEAARRQIWAIADRASDEEEADIRAMTRSLEHLENGLRNPDWPAEPPGQSG